MGKEAKVCGSGMKKVSYVLKTSKHTIPEVVGPLNYAKTHPTSQSMGLLPDDHRLSKHFQMSPRACGEQQV